MSFNKACSHQQPPETSQNRTAQTLAVKHQKWIKMVKQKKNEKDVFGEDLLLRQTIIIRVSPFLQHLLWLQLKLIHPNHLSLDHFLNVLRSRQVEHGYLSVKFAAVQDLFSNHEHLYGLGEAPIALRQFVHR